MIACYVTVQDGAFAQAVDVGFGANKAYLKDKKHPVNWH